MCLNCIPSQFPYIAYIYRYRLSIFIWLNIDICDILYLLTIPIFRQRIKGRSIVNLNIFTFIMIFCYAQLVSSTSLLSTGNTASFTTWLHDLAVLNHTTIFLISNRTDEHWEHWIRESTHAHNSSKFVKSNM